MVMTEVASQHSFRYSGPTRQCSQESDLPWLELRSEFAFKKMTTRCLSRGVGIGGVRDQLKTGPLCGRTVGHQTIAGGTRKRKSQSANDLR
jgi:hypothetical protein